MNKHGHASNWKGKKASSTYRSWTSMVQRCNNPNHEHHGSYREFLCESWKDFTNFLNDMGERPDGMSIDRIDNTKGYYKENCRWATAKEQVRNRLNSLDQTTVAHVISRRAEGASLKEISEELCLNISRVKNIIYRGDYC